MCRGVPPPDPWGGSGLSARHALARNLAPMLAWAPLMFETLKPWLLLIVVVVGIVVAASWSVGRRWVESLAAREKGLARKMAWMAWVGRTARRWESTHRLLMAVCACLGVWTFTFFGEFHDHGVFGHVNFHSHDCYHYYFGSKYLKEWGYDGMYVATLGALEEIGRDEPRKAIRSEERRVGKECRSR